MGMMKEMGMQIEEQVYGCIEDIIPECEDIAEALERGVEIARGRIVTGKHIYSLSP